jgi:hypothetical protein
MRFQRRSTVSRQRRRADRNAPTRRVALAAVASTFELADCNERAGKSERLSSRIAATSLSQVLPGRLLLRLGAGSPSETLKTRQIALSQKRAEISLP